MTILIKLGGSLITDKTNAKSFRPERVRRIASQVVQLRALSENIRIIMGHGSGSFGHFEARKYRTVEGVETDREHRGFVKVGAVAAELSLLAQYEFLAAGLPTMRFQPSSTLIASNRRIISFDSRALAMALDRQLVPLIHGDIAIDDIIGGTIISTEALFAHLVDQLDVKTIILLGEVDGVLDQNGELISRITPSSLAGLRSALAGSHGVDVTGGMLQKVESMVALARGQSSLDIIIADGRRDNVLVDLLIHRREIGTRICADA